MSYSMYVLLLYIKILTLLKQAAALRADWENLTFSVTVTTCKNDDVKQYDSTV